MPKTKFKLGDMVTFSRIISTKTEICEKCDGAGGFEDDTHYGGISHVGCSGCNGRGKWQVKINPFLKKEGPFKITAIKMTDRGTLYMLNQRILMDWKFEPKYFEHEELTKINEK